MDVRETALEILLEAEKTGAFAENLLRDALGKYDYENPRQKALLKRLTEGTLERLLTLDFCLDSVSSVKTERMKPLIRCLLRLSAYQILFLESVPDRAACSEAVRLAKKRGFSRLSGFVNGVLRSLAREKGSFVWPDARKEPVRALSVAYSVPEWIVSLWIGQYGQERTEKMLKALLIPRPVTIRFRSDITEKRREETVARFRERGITAERHPLYPGAWTLDGCEGVASLPGVFGRTILRAGCEQHAGGGNRRDFARNADHRPVRFPGRKGCSGGGKGRKGRARADRGYFGKKDRSHLGERGAYEV